MSDGMSIWRRASLAFTLAMVVQAGAARGQDAAETPRPRQPTTADVVRFHQAVDEVSAHSEMRARLAEARRVAPFDLYWGLR